jgi:hypothetical protein
LYLFVGFLTLLVVLVVVVRRPAPRTAAILLVCVAGLAWGRSAELAAQQMQLRPHAGLYLPTRIAFQNGALHLRQKIGVTMGARVTLTFNDRFDVVTGVTYIPGYAVLRGAGKRIQVGTGSQQLTAATRARYWLLPPTRKFTWEVHTGVGMASGGQRAYEDLFEGSTVTGIIGTTVRYQIGGIVTLQMRVQERLYRVRFGGGDPGRSRPPLRVSLGLSFPFLDALVRPADRDSEEAQ